MEEEIIVERVKEAKTYSCGLPLFLLDSPLHDTIVVGQNCCCADPVEGAYYTATLKKFPPVCSMAEGFVTESIAELQRQYAVVHPLYSLCQLDDKTHKVGIPTTLPRGNELISGERCAIIFMYLSFFAQSTDPCPRNNLSNFNGQSASCH